jgi:hypothetical protein
VVSISPECDFPDLSTRWRTPSVESTFAQRLRESKTLEVFVPPLNRALTSGFRLAAISVVASANICSSLSVSMPVVSCRPL